jgi:hypothetical protein
MLLGRQLVQSLNKLALALYANIHLMTNPVDDGTTEAMTDKEQWTLLILWSCETGDPVIFVYFQTYLDCLSQCEQLSEKLLTEIGELRGRSI